jgi:hypothetical protein
MVYQMKVNKLVACVTTTMSLSALLAACGGGGGGGDGAVTSNTAPPTAAPVSASAEGVYEGSISNGRSHTTLILENDQFFTLYGSALSSGLAVSGFIQGTGKSVNGSFSSTDLKDFFPDGTSVAGSLSASYVPKSSLNGSVTESSSTVTFTGTSPLKNSLYIYDTPANLADIVGAWSMIDLQGSSAILSISSSGSFAGSVNGCSFSGGITPRASGKNVFDVALTFGPSPCRLAGKLSSGIAVEYVSGGKRQLLIAGTDTTRTSGTAFFGQR